MNTYLIEAKNGMAKIGAAHNPEYRCNCLALGSPVQLRLVAILPSHSESDLHKKFSEYREHNEWFRIEGEFAVFFDRSFGVGLKREVRNWVTDWPSFYAERRKALNEKLSAAHRSRKEFRIAVHQKEEATS